VRGNGEKSHLGRAGVSLFGVAAQAVPIGPSALFVYDAFGGLAMEEGGSAGEATGTQYLHGDHLGSTRLTTDGNGMVARRYDYRPFGAELTSGDTAWRTTALKYGAGSDVRLKFTGKERDAETGLDYFGARYMSAAQGRFTSPDAPFADQNPLDPQSWNLYGYVRNSPLRYVDSDGRECVSLDNGTQGDDGKGTPCPGAQLGTSDQVTSTARAPETDYGWAGLAFRFVTGSLKPVETFNENDTYTQQLRQSKLIKKKVRIAGGLSCSGALPDGSVSEQYSTYPSSWRSDKKIQDGVDFVTKPGSPDTAVASLGSFGMSYRTVGASGGSVRLAFSISNEKSYSSLARDAKAGYNSSGGVLLNRPAWLGNMMRTVQENITWEEDFACPAN
jgi:RHS repeat-associated protein